MKTLRAIADQYFAAQPDAKNEVMKACYAYHESEKDPYRHFFNGPDREDVCVNCGRSRVGVRWDDLTHRCEKYRADIYNPLRLTSEQVVTIKGVLHAEEALFAKLNDRATREVPRIVAKLGMSGETLAILHHTHGYCPETVAGPADVPPQVMADYLASMESERERSRADTAVKRKVIEVV